MEPYTQVYVLIRFHGQPVGKALFPVRNGRIDNPDLRQELVTAAGSALWEQYLRRFLDFHEADFEHAQLPKATIATCTRDRPEDLRRCLQAILLLPNDGQEILVIDNASQTEETRLVVQSFECVRYVREQRPGLDIARNRALREASNEIVAFVDDDAAPEPDWLRALVQNFGDPLVLCVTGLTVPSELETPAQEWFERHATFSRGFHRRVFDYRILRPWAAGQVGAGANMALRRSVLELVGPFDEALDGGTRSLSGGDSEMFSRILAQRYRIVYDPRALCRHRHRRTWAELLSTIYGYGVGTYAFWTRKVLYEGEFGPLGVAWAWLWYQQLPNLIRAVLQRPDSPPLDLCIAELRGCLTGPGAYVAARRAVDQQDRNAYANGNS